MKNSKEKEGKDISSKIKKDRLDPVTNFFSSSAGVNTELIKQAPTEIPKHTMVGVILWVTALIATFSGGYFLFKVFASFKMAVLFGVTWGAIIFSLDRFFVISMAKSKSRLRNFGVASPRLILAALLGIVISKPLEMRIFEKEITQEIREMNFNDRDSLNRVTRERTEVAQQQLYARIDSINNDVVQQRQITRQAEISYINEKKGTNSDVTTGKPGYGPEAKRKEKIFDNEQARLDSLIAYQQREIPRVENDLARIESVEDSLSSPVKEGLYDWGALRELDALFSLVKKEGNLRMRITVNLITLIFILLEMAPVLVKLTLKQGVYEKLVHKLETELEEELIKDLDKISRIRDMERERELDDQKKSHEVIKKKKSTRVRSGSS